MEKSVVLRDGSVLQIFRPRAKTRRKYWNILKQLAGRRIFC